MIDTKNARDLALDIADRFDRCEGMRLANAIYSAILECCTDLEKENKLLGQKVADLKFMIQHEHEAVDMLRAHLKEARLRLLGTEPELE